MTEQFKFSVIVPSYNAALTVHDTYKSIVAQNFSGFEIIFINDGSTDNTAEILNEISTLDQDVLVINQPNLGPNAARNAAIRVARGDYVIFLDADDQLLENTMSKLFNIICSDLPDFINYGYRFVKENTIISQSNYTPKVLTGREIFKSALEKAGIAGVCWNKCFSRNFLIKNSLQFIPDKVHGRDLIFSRQCAVRASKVIIIPDILVESYIQSRSFSRKYSEKNINSALKIVEDHIDLFMNAQNKDLENEITISLIRHLNYTQILAAFRMNEVERYFVAFQNLKKAKTNIVKMRSSYHTLSFTLLDVLTINPYLLRALATASKFFGREPY